MARAADEGLIHCDTGILLLLLVLRLLPCTAPPAGVHSLCYNFTLNKSESGPWSNEVQGLLNREIFLDCDSSNECKTLRMNPTEKQFEFLKDAYDLFKEKLLDLKDKNHTIREPLRLQATMCCQAEGDRHMQEHWDFSLNGEKVVHFDSGKRKWTEDHPGSRWVKETWENDRDMPDFLYKNSVGDCRTWLQEFRHHWKEELHPTAPITVIPGVDQQPSTAMMIKPCVLLVVLTCSLTLLIYENLSP